MLEDSTFVKFISESVFRILPGNVKILGFMISQNKKIE